MIAASNIPRSAYSGGPSVLVTGWVAILIIIGGICTALAITWKVLWPLLRTAVALLEQMDFFRHAEEAHEELKQRVDAHDEVLHDHEGRIAALEHRP